MGLWEKKYRDEVEKEEWKAEAKELKEEKSLEKRKKTVYSKWRSCSEPLQLLLLRQVTTL